MLDLSCHLPEHWPKGDLCGSVALQYTWNLLTFSLPVLRGGTVHGLCHSPSYEFVFINIVQFMMRATSRIRFGLQIVFVCLYITPSHYHHCANFIWRHWTYKMPVRYSLSSVWVRLSIFSQLSIIQYVGLCVFSPPISFVMIERIYILCLIIITKSEVWTITHHLGLGHETMVCAVCLSIFSLIKNIALVHEMPLFCSKTITWGIMTQLNQGNDYLFNWLYLDWKFCPAVLIRAMKKRHSWLDFGDLWPGAGGESVLPWTELTLA